MVKNYHDNGVEKPLSHAEIRKSEFFYFKEFSSGNHFDDVFAQKSDGYARKSIDSARIFKNVNAQSQQKAQKQKHITVSEWRIKHDENDINVWTNAPIEIDIAKDKNLNQYQNEDCYNIY